MLRCYTLASGALVVFCDSDFDYIVNVAGCEYKHSKTYDLWFDAYTNKEVADPDCIRSLNLRCVDSNANCHKNITSNYLEGYTFDFRKMEKKEGYSDMFKAMNAYASYIMYNTPLYTPVITKIIVNGKTTIVLWKDGTKTIVRPSERDAYDLEAAVCAAIAKKIYGSNSAFKRMIRDKVIVQENKKKEKKDANKA